MREFQEVLAAVRELFTVPNSMLPAELQDRKRGGRTMTKIDQILDKKLPKTNDKKATKAENLTIYEVQVQTETELTGKVNELQLYKNQMAFYKGLVEAGWFDDDDSDE